MTDSEMIRRLNNVRRRLSHNTEDDMKNDAALQMAIKSLREPKGVIPVASVSIDVDWKRIERMVERQVKECSFEWSEDHKDQIIVWLSKFCFHIDMVDKHLTDDEAREFWGKKMHDQFGW